MKITEDVMSRSLGTAGQGIADVAAPVCTVPIRGWRNLTLPPERGCPQPQHVEKAKAAAAQESRAPSALP